MIHDYRYDDEIPQKQHSGKLIPYDASPFELFDEYGILEAQTRRWKNASLKGKAALVEKP